MPIYEYKCDNGHVFDVMQKFSDEPLTACQECGAPAARVLTPPAIHFKGSGFHNTDYGKKGGTASSAGSNGGSESSGDSSSGAGDSGSSSSSSGAGDSKSGSSDSKSATTAD